MAVHDGVGVPALSRTLREPSRRNIGGVTHPDGVTATDTFFPSNFPLNPSLVHPSAAMPTLWPYPLMTNGLLRPIWRERDRADGIDETSSATEGLKSASGAESVGSCKRGVGD